MAMRERIHLNEANECHDRATYIAVLNYWLQRGSFQ